MQGPKMKITLCWQVDNGCIWFHKKYEITEKFTLVEALKDFVGAEKVERTMQNILQRWNDAGEDVHGAWVYAPGNAELNKEIEKLEGTMPLDVNLNGLFTD